MTAGVLALGELAGEGGLAAFEVSNPVGWAILGGTALYLGWKWYHSANEKADEQGAQAPPAATCDCPASTPADPNQQEPDEEQQKQADKQKQADARSEAGRQPDRGGLTKAGRALAKHGGREGSAFPKSSGTPSEINAQGQKIVDDIVRDPQAAEKPNRFGGSDVTAPDGRGVRFGADGSMMGLLEP